MVKHQEIEFLAGGELKSVGNALKGLQDALEKTEKGLLQTLKSAAKTATGSHRSLASFDNLERLATQSKSTEKPGSTESTQKPGSTESTENPGQTAGELTLTAQEISAILTAAVTAFSAAVEEKLQRFATWNGGGITDGLTGILAAVGAVQALLSGDNTLPLWLSGITGAFSSAGQAVTNLGGMLTGFFSPALGSLAGLMGDLTDGGLSWNGAYEKLGLSAMNLGGILGKLTSPMGLVRTAADALAGGIRTLIKDWGGVGTIATSVWESIKSVWSPVADWFQKRVFTPLADGLRLVVNVVIGMVNVLITVFVGVINAVVSALNLLSFKVPDWVPGLGGKRFGFQIKPVETPQIPYLAQGAVLPANRPFLAMVGDQKHGTNIEAPLTTIQEAVSLVMEDYAASNLAGHQATVSVLQELLAAVLGISIGDDTLAAAVDRYNGKLSVVRGGYL